MGAGREGGWEGVGGGDARRDGEGCPAGGPFPPTHTRTFTPPPPHPPPSRLLSWMWGILRVLRRAATHGGDAASNLSTTVDPSAIYIQAR